MTRQPLPVRTLRDQPDLEQLKRQAKEVLHSFRSGDSAAIAEVSAHYHGVDRRTFALHDAQLVIARAYGFESRNSKRLWTARRCADSWTPCAAWT